MFHFWFTFNSLGVSPSLHGVYQDPFSYTEHNVHILISLFQALQVKVYEFSESSAWGEISQGLNSWASHIIKACFALGYTPSGSVDFETCRYPGVKRPKASLHLPAPQVVSYNLGHSVVDSKRYFKNIYHLPVSVINRKVGHRWKLMLPNTKSCYPLYYFSCL